ncbi:hypothetical protein BKA65DRAFT_498051 [Rhexocercosporidium sp. MPI-PUGE-AT-0058]|nr:hypothetical protein BKA65DRAFT_498051 [Rhexocercosporidium sp. MPI-PUGE-AT-0058]
MRYTRLRRQIESGSLNASHNAGPSSSSPPPPISPNPQWEYTPTSVPKRKRAKKTEATVVATNASTTPIPTLTTKEDNEASEKEKESLGTGLQSKASDVGTSSVEEKRLESERKAKHPKDSKIKLECQSGSETDFNSGSEDDEDSEDEMPLAKLRQRRGLAGGLGLVPKALVSSTAKISGHAYPPVALPTAPVYNTYANSPEGYSSLEPVAGNGNASLLESPRYVPQGFNALAIGSRGASGNVGFDGRSFVSNAGRGGGANCGMRGLYASPYAGWIDGQSHGDQMGAPGPGWEQYARYQRPQPKQQSQHQNHELEQSGVDGDEVPRKSG